ncbi:MAG TPA: orotidine-5'-phosphate decarboxylase [Candidatus Nanoarchaeia archaeon]|nr:orotidine-5'-phosphate decarboxylase [Candidatus Nanoarchaeia archaeon]
MAISLTDTEIRAKEFLCLALDDITSLNSLEQRVIEMIDLVGIFKVGSALFTKFGPYVVKTVQDNGGKVFLDLKYHDTPEQVFNSAANATSLDVHMFTVHATGGLKMMEYARDGAIYASKKLGTQPPKIIGATVLTSINQETLSRELKIDGKVEDQVLNLALLSYVSGLHGVVCSGLDLPYIRDKLPRSFMYVTPGIRHNTRDTDGRECTPEIALANGSSMLVLGKAINEIVDSIERVEATYKILQEIASSNT